MNGNLTFVLILSLFSHWGWDIQLLKNYIGTCFIFTFLAFGTVMILNMKLNALKAAHNADPRNASLPFSPALGAWERAWGIYAENVSWIVSLSWCYAFFLCAYDTDNIKNVQTLSEFGSDSSNALIAVYSAFTVIVTVGYTAFDTYSKSSAGFFDKNKARTTDAGSFEVTVDAKVDFAAAEEESTPAQPVEEDKWSLLKGNFQFTIKTIHGIMIVQWLKDNSQVFRQGLSGTVGVEPDACDLSTFNGTTSEDAGCYDVGTECYDCLEIYYSAQNNEKSIADLYTFWVKIFVSTIVVLMIPKFMKWFCDTHYEDSTKCTFDKTQYKQRYFIAKLSERFNNNWKSAMGFVFAKCTQALIVQYIKPTRGDESPTRWFMLAIFLSIGIGGLSEWFRNMDDWQKQNIAKEDFIDDDDVDDFVLHPTDPLALRIELEELKAWKEQFEKHLGLPHKEAEHSTKSSKNDAAKDLKMENVTTTTTNPLSANLRTSFEPKAQVSNATPDIII